MNKNAQSALIRQAATMCSYALEMPRKAEMSATKRNLEGYEASLTLVNDGELKPFGQQAIIFVKATLKYLRFRTEKNLINARNQRDKLAKMMADALAEMEGK